MRFPSQRSVIAISVMLFLSACASMPQPATTPDESADNKIDSTKSSSVENIEQSNTEQADRSSKSTPNKTNSDLVLHQPTQATIKQSANVLNRPIVKHKGKVSLNFVKTDIVQVIDMIMGEILEANYIVDPMVKGVVNVQTSQAIPRENVLSMLEKILALSGYRLVHNDGVYEITSNTAGTSGELQLGMVNSQFGFGYQIVPLQFINAEEMSTIVQSVVGKDTIMRVDAKRNLLILAGSSVEQRKMLDLVEVFDVNWLDGMAVEVVRLDFIDNKTVQAELEKYISGNEMTAGMNKMVTVSAMDSINSLLLVSTQKAFIEDLKKIIQVIDQPGEGEGQRLYVYAVQNAEAQELAKSLGELFDQDVNVSENTSRDEVALAPGLQPFSAASAEDENATPKKVKSPDKPSNKKSRRDSSGEKPRIIAASTHNSLLIMASPTEYSKIKNALQQLDIPPLQVLVEASIYDVRLVDEFSYGMQWFFDNKLKYGLSGAGQVGTAVNIPASFSYSITSGAGILKGLLQTLATDGKVKVLSSPSLMVRNNETASIRVGDQQPVSTALVSSEGKVVASSVQFKDTGVLLEVSPQINSGGLISLDVAQEVTDVGDIDSATGQRSFLRRSIKSSVAVNSNETIVLGGLIRENKASGNNGVPYLRKIPLIGILFGKSNESTSRTELIVTLTPRIVRNQREAHQVTNAFRAKLTHLNPKPNQAESVDFQ